MSEHKRSPLTDEELISLFNKVVQERHAYPERRFRGFARYVEQALKEKKDDKPQIIIIHGDGCWSWGPAHYECACKELAKAKGWGK